MIAAQVTPTGEGLRQEDERAFHPLANAFPLMEGEAFNELVEDIRDHGVREPITLYEGQILDGRNRYRASRAAGVECPIAEYDGEDPVGYVISLNLARRHLSQHERAAAAARLANATWGGARRSGQDGSSHLDATDHKITNEQAAAALKVSKDSVRRARVVLEHGAPNVVEAMESGEVPIAAAAKAVKTVPPEEQAKWKDVAVEVRKSVGTKERTSDTVVPNRKAIKEDEKFKIRQLQAEIRRLKNEKSAISEKLNDMSRWHSQRTEELAWAWEWADELERRSGALPGNGAGVQSSRVMNLPVVQVRQRERPLCTIDEDRVFALAQDIEEGQPKEPVPVRRAWRNEDRKWLNVWEVVGDPHPFEAYKGAGSDSMPCVLASGLAGLDIDLAFAQVCLLVGDTSDECLRNAENTRRNTIEELSKRIKALGQSR